MNTDFDIAVCGAGFGGALIAMIARKLGYSVLLVERGTHPRFAIGESTSPLTNLLIEQIVERYDLPRLAPLASFGLWQRAYPNVVCGLKRGFTYYQQQSGQPFAKRADRQDQLMVAASPNDELADTHWLRADVDWFLVLEAIAQGVEYADRTQVTEITGLGGEQATLTGTRNGKPFRASARFVVDATGPRGLLARLLNLPETSLTGYPLTQALFSHFVNVRRCDMMPQFWPEGKPLREPNSVPPYPSDDAALHHVFEGGWMWVLRFGNGVTSAGVAVEDWLAQELNLADPCREAAWERVLARFPSVWEQFRKASPVQPFVYAPRLTYRGSMAAGDGWAMLPSAAAFIDPLFSTGFPLTLLGIERLGLLLERHGIGTELNAHLPEYSRLTLEDADNTAEFIGACYHAFADFPIFAALSMFYFAAASYSEMARRLDKRHLVSRFLAADRQDFRAGWRACLASLDSSPRPDPESFVRQVQFAIECLNVAGLCAPEKRGWYGVDLADVVRNAAKLDMTPESLQAVIATAAWAGN